VDAVVPSDGSQKSIHLLCCGVIFPINMSRINANNESFSSFMIIDIHCFISPAIKRGTFISSRWCDTGDQSPVRKVDPLEYRTNTSDSMVGLDWNNFNVSVISPRAAWESGTDSTCRNRAPVVNDSNRQVKL
jgi:predicted ATP-dependent Lon-type protease